MFERKIKHLRQRKAELFDAAKANMAAAEAEQRALTAEETAKDDALRADLEQVNAELARAEEWQAEQHAAAEQRFAERDAEASRAGEPAPAGGGYRPRAEVRDPPTFRSLGEQLQAIAIAGMNGPRDPRLDNEQAMQAAATGAGAAVPQDGGFLIRTAWSDELLQGPRSQSVLYPDTRKVPIPDGFDGIELPIIDETSRATGSRWGGVRLYRANEGDSVTATKPRFAENYLQLHDLLGLAYATDRLIRNAAGLESMFRESIEDEYTFMLDDEIYNGDGAGKMTGVLNADAAVSVAKENNQAAATVVYENLLKMWERMPSAMKPRSKWVYNSEVFPQLMQMTLAVGTGGVPAFMPPNGISGQPFGTLMGRPAVEIEQAAALGTVGDIALLAMREYVVIEQGGVEFASSMHVRFIQHEMAFRWKLANNGRPIWNSSVTPYKGSNAKSPYIFLASRT